MEILFLTTTFLKLSQYFSEKGVGRAPHGSPLGTPMLLTGGNNVVKVTGVVHYLQKVSGNSS